MMTNEQELAYLAGFFDGEGTIGVYVFRSADWEKGRRTPQMILRASVSGNHKDSIERFGRRWPGGHLQLQIRGTHRPLWSWTVTGSRAKSAIGEMLPYLNVKKAQAFEALKTPVSEPGVNLADEDRLLRVQIGQRLKQLKAEVA